MENNANNGHEAYDDQVIFVDTHLIQKAVEGLQRSREEFQSLLEQAEGGDPAAYYDLGVRYAEGDGAERDPARAAHWFSLAAEDGDLRAVDLLGRCYQAGSGVEKDEARAVELFQQAADLAVGHVVPGVHAAPEDKDGYDQQNGNEYIKAYVPQASVTFQGTDTSFPGRFEEPYSPPYTEGFSTPM